MKNMLNKITRLLTAVLFVLGLTFTSCTEKNATKFGIEIGLQLANRDCPMEIDEGEILTKVTLDNDVFTYNVEVDEEISELDFDYANTKEASDDLKATFQLLSTTDKDTKELLQLCKESKFGIAFKYTGKQSGRKAVTAINYTDIP